MQRAIFWAGLALFAAGATQADPVDGDTARKLMFSPKGIAVSYVGGAALSDSDKAQLEAVIGLLGKQKQDKYYGAIAIAPDEGLASVASVALMNYHSVEAASDAALRECNAKKQVGGRACVVVAEIRPEGWEPRALQLSADATDDLRKSYRKGKGPKALALSPSTGVWAIARGEGAAAAAIQDCKAQARVDDCQVAVAD